MRQQPDDLAHVVGYVLKHAQASLRTRMDDTLRPLGLSTPQYVCMELLSRTPGISSSDLARNAFVTRQTMSTLLRGLQDRGLVERPEQAPSGRARPTALSPEGARLLALAQARADAVDAQMVAGLTSAQTRDLLRYLEKCIDALEGDDVGRTDATTPTDEATPDER